MSAVLVAKFARDLLSVVATWHVRQLERIAIARRQVATGVATRLLYECVLESTLNLHYIALLLSWYSLMCDNWNELSQLACATV